MREGRRFVRSALHTRDDPPFFVFLTFSCIYLDMWDMCSTYVSPAKLHCGATPQSVMALLIEWHAFSAVTPESYKRQGVPSSLGLSFLDALPSLVSMLAVSNTMILFGQWVSD